MIPVNRIIGNYLVHGDNLDIMDKLPANSINMILTDPPYCYTKGNDNSNSNKRMGSTGLYDGANGGELCRINSKFGKEDIYRWLNKTIRLMRRYNAYIFCNDEQLSYYLEWANGQNLFTSVMVWEKPLKIISKKSFSSDVEFIVRIYSRAGIGLNLVSNTQWYSRVIHDTPVSPNFKLHPTQKPLDIYRRFVLLSTSPGDTILDPFAGSASSCVSAFEEGRQFVGIEKNIDFYNIAEKRLYDTGAVFEKDAVFRFDQGRPIKVKRAKK